MIVPMKKMTLLISTQSKQQALNKCRELGVLHIQHIQPPQGEEIDLLIHQCEEAEKALTFIGQIEVKYKKSKKTNPAEIVKDILDTHKQ